MAIEGIQHYDFKTLMSYSLHNFPLWSYGVNSTLTKEI